MHRISIILLMFVSFFAPLLSAQPSRADCSGAGHHRDFDFWVGEWTVHDAEGKLAGENRITAVQKGCILEEYWTSARGNTGQSSNYYHPGRGQWHQLWLDAGGGVIDIRGGLEQEAMVLTGSIYSPGEGTEKAFRGRWTPLPDGRVRQFFEEQDSAGQWQVWFDGYYTRKPGSPQGQTPD